LSCGEEEEDPIDLEISPLPLIAASVISENERTTIEQGLSTAMINVMDRGPVHNFRIQTKKKQQLKRLS
jgi:hypothetical protein